MVLYTESMGNIDMTNLAKQIYQKAARATASVETIVAEGVVIDGVPSVDVEPQKDLQQEPEFRKEHEEVEAVTSLIEAAADATSAAEVVNDAEEVRDDIDETVELAEGLNEAQGGVSIECFGVFQAIVDRLAARVGVESINIGEGLESVSESGKVRINVAGLEALSEQISAAMPSFLKKSGEVFNTMTDAMLEAVPEVRDRLTTLLGDLQMDNKPLDGSVSVSQEIRNALSVDGSVPEDLVTYFATYAELGEKLLGEYLRRSGTSGEALSGMLGQLDYNLPEGFWDTVAEILDKVGDPRAALGKDSMAISLPGSGKLFIAAEPPQTDGNPTYAKMAEYVLVNAPVVGCDTDEGSDAPAMEAEDLPDLDADDAGEADPAEDADATDPVIDPTTADGSADGAPAPDADAVNVAEATLDPAAADPAADPAVAAPVVEAPAPAPDPNAMKSLNRDQLRTIVKSLLSLLDDAKIAGAIKQLERNWLVTQAAAGEAVQTVRSVTGDVQQALGPQLEIIPRYVKLIHQLSVWPVTRFLTNLILTSNAIVAMGTAMATGERLPEPEPVPTADPVADPVADPIADSTTPAAPPADGGTPDASIDGAAEPTGDLGDPLADSSDPSAAPASATDPALGTSGDEPTGDVTPADAAAAAPGAAGNPTEAAVADGSDAAAADAEAASADAAAADADADASAADADAAAADASPADLNATPADVSPETADAVAEVTADAGNDDGDPTNVPAMEPTPAPNPEDPLAQAAADPNEDAEGDDEDASSDADPFTTDTGGTDDLGDLDATNTDELDTSKGEQTEGEGTDEPASTETKPEGEEEEEEEDDNKPTA